MKRILISTAAGAVLLLAAGCGDSDDTQESPEPATAGTFVKKVNALCGTLEQDVLSVVQDERYPTAQEYLAIQKKLEPVFATFDEQVDALEVPDADKAAARTFNAYRAESDRAIEKLAAAAASGDEGTYSEAFAANDKAYDASSAVKAVKAAGFYCPAR